jgi:ribonuclease HI
VPSFVCKECGKNFELSDATLSKYPGWQPKRCLACRKAAETPSGRNPDARRGPKRPTAEPTRRLLPRSSNREENLTVSEVLNKYTAGPQDGVFTDGAAEPNPGPGGWGAVYVSKNEILGERWGSEPHTTNNRMELTALLAGCALVPEGTPAVIYTDSQLCVSTITEWAKGWKARGWKRKGGEIKNLELVKEAYALFERRPELELRWIAAHAGNRWNEYADSLATAYRRTKR